MAYKIIDATSVKPGNVIVIDGEPCTVKSIDISKTGKHGHAKARIEAVGIINGKKKVIAVPGHERFEVPMVTKKKAQILSISNNRISAMDLESYETIDLPMPDKEEVGEDIVDGDQVEYWDVDGKFIIKRKI